MLRRSSELRVDVAASQRPVPSAGTEVEFEDSDFVARAPELDRRRHSGEACAQNDDRSPFGIALEVDRAAVRRFRREPEPGHEPVGRGSADARAYELKKPAPAYGPSTDGRLPTPDGGYRPVAHRLVPSPVRGDTRDMADEVAAHRHRQFTPVAEAVNGLDLCDIVTFAAQGPAQQDCSSPLRGGRGAVAA
jgi:hypothetical protein